MKSLLLACLCLLITASVFSQTKKIALLVGVSQYPEGSGWRTINSKNDLILLREVLAAKDFEVQTLAQHHATKKGILDALQTAAENTPPGSVFHFHFSGHGQQMADLSGDEFDDLDEALVPFDAPDSLGKGGYRGDRHLSDDELGAALDAIRLRIGGRGQVFVSLDACHSGTATRNLSVCRGTAKLLAPPDFTPVPDSTKQETPFLEDWASGQDFAPLVVFSATSAQQPNRECALDSNGYGPLSLALATALNEASTQTWQGLFDQVRAAMAITSPRQTPRAEGALHLDLWQNQRQSTTTAKVHFTVLDAPVKKELVLAAGLLHRLQPGTRLVFFPPDTRQPDDARPIAAGVVTSCDLLQSTVLLDEGVNKKTIQAAWAFVEGKSLEGAQLTVKVDLPDHPDLAAELRRQLADFPAIALADSDFDLLVEQTGNGKIQVLTNDEQRLGELEPFSAFADATYLAQSIIARHAQAQFLKKLEHADPHLKVRLEIVPVVAGSAPAAPGSVFTLRSGEEFYIEVVNEGKKACYLSLLDVQADAKIKALAPGEGSRFQPDDYFLLPGKRKRLRPENSPVESWRATPPFGFETLKLIATEAPLDLRPLLAMRGLSAEENSPVARIFSQNLNLRTRSDQPQPSLPGGAAAVVSAVLEIRP